MTGEKETIRHKKDQFTEVTSEVYRREDGTRYGTTSKWATYPHVSIFTSIHPPGFHHHSPRHGALNWYVNLS